MRLGNGSKKTSFPLAWDGATVLVPSGTTASRFGSVGVAGAGRAIHPSSHAEHPGNPVDGGRVLANERQLVDCPKHHGGGVPVAVHVG